MRKRKKEKTSSLGGRTMLEQRLIKISTVKTMLEEYCPDLKVLEDYDSLYSKAFLASSEQKFIEDNMSVGSIPDLKVFYKRRQDEKREMYRKNS